MTQGYTLRQHPRLRGRWLPPPDEGDVNANHPIADEDVLEWVYFYSTKHIVLRTKLDGTTIYRQMFLTSSRFATQLAALLNAKVGRTIAEIGNAEINF